MTTRARGEKDLLQVHEQKGGGGGREYGDVAGRSGVGVEETFWTDEVYGSAAEAKGRLSLTLAPEVRAAFTIRNEPVLRKDGDVVEPDEGEPGGGTEWSTFDAVEVEVIGYEDVDRTAAGEVARRQGGRGLGRRAVGFRVPGRGDGRPARARLGGAPVDGDGSKWGVHLELDTPFASEEGPVVRSLVAKRRYVSAEGIVEMLAAGERVSANLSYSHEVPEDARLPGVSPFLIGSVRLLPSHETGRGR